MSDMYRRIYHILPPALRSVGASLHGYRLRWWRYGMDFDRRVGEALERDTWSAERWKSWQDDQLARLLHRAFTRVPYYREAWSERRRRGDKSSPEILANWPVLHRDSVRANPSAFLADDCNIRRMYEDHTSGTTGTPLSIWLTRAAVSGWFAIFEARTRLWHGVSRHDRWGILGGQAVVPADQKKPPYWVWNAGLNQLYMSAMHIASWSSRAYIEAIQKYELKFLVGYSSSLYLLALEAKAMGVQLPLKAVVTNAEPLFDYQRKAMQEGFNCTVQETYGNGEYSCGSSECSSGRLHLWPEVSVMEILDDSANPVPDGTPGRIISTGLLNTDMPLVRYDTRDRGQMSADRSPCSCQRSMPVLQKVWGRWDDVIVTKDGRIPVLLDRVFDPPLRVREGQIIQEAIGEFRVRVVPAEGWSAVDETLLCDSLRELVGEANIKVELTQQIERTWAGKFRIIISKVGKQNLPSDHLILPS